MEPLRNLYTDEKLEAVAESFPQAGEVFPEGKVPGAVHQSPWESAPFKERMRMVLGS